MMPLTEFIRVQLSSNSTQLAERSTASEQRISKSKVDELQLNFWLALTHAVPHRVLVAA